MSSDVMIEASSLSKRWGALRALDKVSFEVRRGEVVGFLGPNGAGKSTTMRILTCFISATSGTARVHNYDVFDDPLMVRKKLGYLPQRAPLYGEMNVWEYLSFVAEMRGLDRGLFKKRMRSIVEVCGLATVLGMDIRTLSHGYRQRVGLGQALLHDPPILILDEPTSDLDPNEKYEVIRYIKEIGKERTIVLSTHDLDKVESACARAIIVSKGRLVVDGPIHQIRTRSGKVRYVVTVDDKRIFEGVEGYRPAAKKPPSVQEVQAALSKLPGVTSVSELPAGDRGHSFELIGALSADIRPEIFQLVVQKGWLLLELRRDLQSLEDVFRFLTRGDELRDRGRKVVEEDDEDDTSANAPKAGAASDDEDDEDEDEDEDADEDEDEDEDEDAEDENDDAGDKVKAAKKG